MEKTLDAAHDMRALVIAHSQRLKSLAGAASMLGMRGLHDDLVNIANDLSGQSKILIDAVGHDVHKRVTESEQATANMLAASLGAVTTERSK